MTLLIHIKLDLLLNVLDNKKVWTMLTHIYLWSRITFIWTLIVIATINKLWIQQIDVKIIFLNGDLGEKVYIEQPEGFVVNGQENKSL